MGQSITAPAALGREYVDPIRVRQKPMPAPGSWGIVLIPNGDIRNATWICSISVNQALALTYTGDATDPYLDYTAHFSGHWTMLDGKGNAATEFADGSTFVMGATSGVPPVFRYTVDKDQNQQKTAYTRAERIPNPPATFYANFAHNSGTTLSIDPSGNCSVSGASGASGVAPASGSISFGHTVFSIDGSGNTTVSGAAGASITVMFGAATLTINASGLTTLALPGTETFDITQGGGSPTDFLVLVSKFITAFNNHTHKNVAAGGSNTGTPTTNLAAADVKSAAVLISS